MSLITSCLLDIKGRGNYKLEVSDETGEDNAKNSPKEVQQRKCANGTVADLILIDMVIYNLS